MNLRGHDAWKTTPPDDLDAPVVCDRCGDAEATTDMDGAPVCGACFRYLDNYEPGDPNGESFRGGERAAYDRAQQLVAMRVKG